MGRQFTNSFHRSLGFTIVEVATVIVVIGILAAISIVGYGAWRTNIANDEVQNDLNGVSAGMESARNWNDDGFPEYVDNTEFNTANNTDAVFESSDSVTLTYKWGTPETYCIEGASVAVPSVIYHYRLTASEKTLAQGACPTES